MKKIITIVAAMLFIFAVGAALADQMPTLTENREVGALLNIEAPGPVKQFPVMQLRGGLLLTPEDVIYSAAKKDFIGPPISETLVDVGTELYMSAFETKLAEGITGAAAGGVAREDENTRIWDKLLAPTGGSLE